MNDDRLVTEFGIALAKDIDPDNKVLSPEFRHEIERIESAEKLQELIYTNLGDTMAFNHENAARIFGNILSKKIEVPAMLMAWRFFQIIQCQEAIKLNTELANDPTIKSKDRVAAGKMVLEALKHLDRLINNLSKVAEKLGLLKPKEKEPPVKIPRNRPPEF